MPDVTNKPPAKTSRHDRIAFRNYLYNTLKVDKDWVREQVRDLVALCLRKEIDRRLGMQEGERLVITIVRDIVREEMERILNLTSSPPAKRLDQKMEEFILAEVKKILAERFKLSVRMELLDPEPKVDRVVVHPQDTFRGVREV